MMARPAKLAILGGAPHFAEKLHVGAPNLGDEEAFLHRVREVFRRRWLTNQGVCVREFEAELCRRTGAAHCVAVCNGTMALEIAARALGLSGEVILPSLTFVATAHALMWQGIRPVFADVRPETWHLDPEQVERRITARTTGIVGVHLWGSPCEIEALTSIARRHRLKLLFDAAHALGCSHRGRMIGSFGDAEVFSFHATKICNSFEGGAILTHDPELAARARLLINFGFEGQDNVTALGTNAKMSEVSAAMGLTSLEGLEGFVLHNARNWHGYRQGLARLPGLRLLEVDETEKRNYHYVVLRIDPAVAGLDRDQLQRVLWAENVLARRYFYPGCHRMEPYRSLYPDTGPLPETESLVQHCLCLPTGTAVSLEQVAQVCAIIELAIQQVESICLRVEGSG